MNSIYLIRYGFYSLLILWLMTSIYFGVAGYTRLKIDELIYLGQQTENTKSVMLGNLSFKNKHFLEAYREEIKAAKFFPTYFNEFPNLLVLLITSCSFGILGALTAQVKMIALEDSAVENLKIVSFPILGALIGIIISGLVTLVPTILVSGNAEIKPISIIFLCFFGGLYNKKFFLWLNNVFGNLFRKGDE